MKIISVVGYKKTGKTTLVQGMVSALKEYGSVGTIKHLHEHHINDLGTDTWKHAQAGAEVVIGVTPYELVKFSHKNNLMKALDELADEGMEFGIIEGFKDSNLPKIALGTVEAKNILKRLNDSEKPDIEEIVNITIQQPEYHTMNSLLAKIRRTSNIEKSGAIGTFTGIVNVFGKNDDVRQKIDEICIDLKQKEGIIDVLIHLKRGIIFNRENMVYIVAAAAHKEQLFSVLNEASERLNILI